MAQHYDSIVVGLGGVGSFALRALAKEYSGTRRRCLGIEVGSLFQNDTTNVDCSKAQRNIAAGYSSRGLSRIYRRAYFEHANYVPWIEHSLNVFREMEYNSGMSLMKECGMLLMETVMNVEVDNTTKNYDRSKTHPKHLPPMIASSWNSAQLFGIPTEILNSTDLQDKFPQFHYGSTEIMGLLEPGGGLLRPERIMKVALQEACSSTNVTIIENSIVTKLVDFESQGIVELHVSQRQNSHKVLKVTTNKLLVSIGAWTGSLIPTWNHFLHPVRQVQGWINTKSTNPNPFSSSCMPTFVYITPDWAEGLYGVPCDEDVDNTSTETSCNQKDWLKVGIHKQSIPKNEFHSIDDLCRLSTSPEELHELHHVIPLCINKDALGKDLQLAETKPCLYTMTPDKHFVIGEVSRNIFCVAGLSGHGFKMTPSLGQMMADFAMNKDIIKVWNVDFCSPKRFKSK